MRTLISALWGIAFVAVLVPANAGAQQIGGANPSTPLFQIRAVQDEFSAGMQRTELSGTVLFMANEDVVNDSHIEFLTVTRTATGLVLKVQFTEEGAARLRQMSRIQIGKRLGLLIDSRLVSAPRGAGPLELTSRRMDVGLRLPENEVDSVAAALEVRFDEVPGYNGTQTFELK
jgi:preprotein translocase subunit SecD